MGGAHLALELDDAPHALVGGGALCADEPLPLLGRGVEEAGVDLGLLVLEGDVAGEHVRALQALGHVRVPRAMVQHQAPHQASVLVQLVPHVHELHLGAGMSGGWGGAQRSATTHA